MRILVTGGCGFIGVNLVELLETAGHEVAVVDMARSAILDRIGHKGPRMLGSDIRSPGAVWQQIRGADAVVHLAAMPGVVQSQEDPAVSFVVNVQGTLNVLEACRRSLALDKPTRRVVIASTGAAADCKNPYGAGKRACEALAQGYHHSFGLETVCLRFTNIYGPWSGEKGSVVGAMIQKVQAGEALTIDGDGTQGRDFVHVSDVCRAILKALERSGADREVRESVESGGELINVIPGCAGKTFAIGSGEHTSINDLVAVLREIHEIDPQHIIVTMPGAPRTGEQAARHDISAAASVLGWTPSTSLQEGLQATYDWYQSRPYDEAEGHVISASLVSAYQVRPDSDLWRIEYRDERGFKKRREVTREVLEAEIGRLGARQRVEPTDRTACQLREAEWLLQHIPEEEVANDAPES